MRSLRPMFQRISLMCLLPLLTCDCAGAESAACRNDAACKARGGKFKYCSRSRCVECVTNAACGYGFRCVDGVCEVS